MNEASLYIYLLMLCFCFRLLDLERCFSYDTSLAIVAFHPNSMHRIKRSFAVKNEMGVSIGAGRNAQRIEIELANKNDSWGGMTARGGRLYRDAS